MVTFWVVFAAVAAALLYWLLIITEGTYLGTRVVVWLYDLYARRYDRAKNLSYVFEARFIGLPLVQALSPLPVPRILDVASGTGRVPMALQRAGGAGGLVVGADRSRRMLAEARAATPDPGQSVAYLCADAAALPFGANTFDAVTCLESLEFMASGRAVLAEMVRVLKPGGLLLLSNRVGSDALLFPGRLCRRGCLERVLGEMELRDITGERWQVHYDLVWASKP